MDKIKRLRSMAREALLDYQTAISCGGEPVFPQWADDLLDVCEQAEAGLQILYSAAAVPNRDCRLPG
jgi:hypothetical protein